jgi:hypothetical protein
VKRSALAGAVLLCGIAVARAAQPAPTSCVQCHGDPKWFPDEAHQEIVRGFPADVHAEVGLSCHDCHGGNPDPALAQDFAAAMDPAEPDSYRGAPRRADVPAFCGRCHSDPVYMRRFRPDARVDQEREFATSRHGIALAAGDENVATCVDCHGSHGILRVDDPRAPVYPTRVAETCDSCHGDPQRMDGYTLVDGSPLPTNQLAGWRHSVHAYALLERGDLAAPTCNDCHGNHGAAPPGVDSLAFVCGRCHGREAELFRGSAKQNGFERHNDLYLDGAASCGDCHVLPDPQARLEGLRRFSECATCHGNHLVRRPTVAMLSPVPATPCAFCHESPTLSAPEDQELEAVRIRYEQARDALLSESEGREGEALFDWMVDRTFGLAPHHRSDAASGAAQLLPAFARLFERFRIGKTHSVSAGSGPGLASDAIVRCEHCHVAAPVLAGTGQAYATGAELVERMRDLTVLTARADRTLLAGRRGGVEVRDALTNLDQAVDAQIELEALVHGFRADSSSEFASKQREGLKFARAALAGGRGAIEELELRQRGLAVALGLILIVLIALALKIRRISDR